MIPNTPQCKVNTLIDPSTGHSPPLQHVLDDRPPVHCSSCGWFSMHHWTRCLFSFSVVARFRVSLLLHAQEGSCTGEFSDVTQRQKMSPVFADTSGRFSRFVPQSRLNSGIKLDPRFLPSITRHKSCQRSVPSCEIVPAEWLLYLLLLPVQASLWGCCICHRCSCMCASLAVFGEHCFRNMTTGCWACIDLGRSLLACWSLGSGCADAVSMSRGRNQTLAPIGYVQI